MNGEPRTANMNRAVNEVATLANVVGYLAAAGADVCAGQDINSPRVRCMLILAWERFRELAAPHIAPEDRDRYLDPVASYQGRRPRQKPSATRLLRAVECLSDVIIADSKGDTEAALRSLFFAASIVRECVLPCYRDKARPRR